MKDARLSSIFIAVALAVAPAFAAEAPSVGDAAPPLSADGWLQTPEGIDVSWEALRGKVVVLEFWGTWCGPCVAAIPHLNELAEKFEDEDVVFLSVTFEDEATIRPFLEKRPMHSWIGLDPDKSMPEAYGVKGWPTTFLIDKKGTVAAITYPTNLTPKILRDMLADRAPSLHVVDKHDDSVTPSASASAEPAWFEMSIRPSRGDRASYSGGANAMTIEGQRLTTLLPIAYGVRQSRIDIETELPGEPFDVRVRIPRDDAAAVRRLLAIGLEQAFAFEARTETRTKEVLVMTAADPLGPELVPTVAKDGSSHSSTSGNGMQAVGIPSESIAGYFERQLGKIIVDESGLDGRYDMRFRCDEFGENAILAAADAQLGLQFRADRREVDVLVIRSIAEGGTDE